MIHFGIGRSITNLKLTRWSRLPARASMCGVNLGWRMCVYACHRSSSWEWFILRACNASCSRRAFHKRLGLICVGGRVEGWVGWARQQETRASPIAVSSAIKSKQQRWLWFLQAHVCAHKIRAGISKDTRMILKLVEKVNGGARPSETRVNHPQKRCGETEPPLLSSHRSNYCSSACTAFYFSMRAAPRARCIHARDEWMRGDRGEKS